MSEEAFKAIIAIQDRTAGVFEHLNKRMGESAHAADHLNRHLHGVLEHKGSAFAEMSEAIGEIGERFADVKERASGLFEKVTELIPALGALGAAGSLVGLFEITEKAAEGFAQLNAEAKKIGITRAELGSLGYAAKMTDVPVEALWKGLEKFNTVLAGAKSGKNKEALWLFQHLKVDPKSIHTVTDILPRLADVFHNTAEASMRGKAAVTLFGKGAGAALIPFLREGGEEIAKLMERGRTLKYAPTDAQAKALLQYDEAMKDIAVATQTFSFELGAKLAPVLKPIVEHMTEWVTANRDWITTDISGRVERLAKAAETFFEGDGPEKLKAGLKDIYDRAQSVAEALNGWINVGEAVLAFYVGRFAFGMLKSIGDVAVGLVALPGKAAEAAAASSIALGKIGVASLARAGAYGFLADTVLTTVDPNDRLGSYVDQHVPGAAFIDNLFSHLGVGRTYDEQAAALQPIPALAAPPSAAPGAAGAFGALPPQQGSVDVRVTIDGAPPGTRAEAVGAGIANVGPPDVGYAMGGDGRD